MRIATGGISHETNSFSPWPTELDTFRVKRGAAILDDPVYAGSDGGEVEWLPTLHAIAPPQREVTRSAYTALRDELLEKLRAALPVDGVYLDLHGAMAVEGLGNAETDLAAAVRDAVGPNVLISASFDSHGNLSTQLSRNLDVLTAFRTAPHRDVDETRRRAIDHLRRCVSEGLRPAAVMLKVPVLLPGEYAVTDVEPGRSLYAMVEQIASQPGMMDASLVIGCAWSDTPQTMASVIVVAEHDAAAARREASRLAEAVWQQRHAFGPDTETASVDKAIAAAMTTHPGPVFLADSGDNVTAGAAGDNPLFVERLLAAGASDAVVAGIRDADAVGACAAAGVGATVVTSIGGKLDQDHGRPLAVEGTVVHIDPPASPTLAVLRVRGVDVILTDDWYPFWSDGQFERTGTDPRHAHIIVGKFGYLFADFRQYAARSILALSPGYSTLNVRDLPYRLIRRPIFPLDPDMNWRVENENSEGELRR